MTVCFSVLIPLRRIEHIEQHQQAAVRKSQTSAASALWPCKGCGVPHLIVTWWAGSSSINFLWQKRTYNFNRRGQDVPLAHLTQYLNRLGCWLTILRPLPLWPIVVAEPACCWIWRGGSKRSIEVKKVLVSLPGEEPKVEKNWKINLERSIYINI